MVQVGAERIADNTYHNLGEQTGKLWIRKIPIDTVWI